MERGPGMMAMLEEIGRKAKRLTKESIKAVGLMAVMSGGASAAEQPEAPARQTPSAERQPGTPEQSAELRHYAELIREKYPGLNFSLAEEDSMDMSGNPAKGYELTIDGRRVMFVAAPESDEAFMKAVKKGVQVAEALGAAK